MAADILDWLCEAIVPWFLILMILSAVAMLGVVAWAAFHPEPSFSLVKAEWGCTQSHEPSYMTTMLAGKVTVPQYHHETVCDQWSRK